MSNYPPLVSSVEEFVYHQSQFMRDHFLLNTDLLENCVRAIVPGLEGLTRTDIKDQFFAALQPARRRGSATAAAATKREFGETEHTRISKRVKKESVRAKESKAGDSGYFKRPQGRAPLGKTWDHAKGIWLTDTNAPKDSKPKPSTKGPHPVPPGPRKKGCTWDYQNGRWIPNTSTTGAASPSVNEIEKKRKQTVTAPYAVHTWKQSELKKDERGLFKQPQGRPPLNCYWDRKVGQWREFPF